MKVGNPKVVTAIVILCVACASIPIFLPVTEGQPNAKRVELFDDKRRLISVLWQGSNWKVFKMPAFDSSRRSTWPDSWDKDFLEKLDKRDWHYRTSDQAQNNNLGDIGLDTPIVVSDDLPKNVGDHVVLRVRDIIPKD